LWRRHGGVKRRERLWHRQRKGRQTALGGRCHFLHFALLLSLHASLQPCVAFTFLNSLFQTGGERGFFLLFQHGHGAMVNDQIFIVDREQGPVIVLRGDHQFHGVAFLLELRFKVLEFGM